MSERMPNPAPELVDYVDVGDNVNWYAGGDVTLHPLIGIVIEKSPGGGLCTTNLTIATFTGSGFAIQEGVLHMDNPLCRKEGRVGGGWRHRPLDLAHRTFLMALGAMKWDGDETYVLNPEFDPTELGRAIARLMTKPTRNPGGDKPPPPPAPPVS